MMENTEIINALRCCIVDFNSTQSRRCNECPYRIYADGKKACENKAKRDAADALEAADKRIDVLQKLVDINTKRCEALRKQLREANESYDKRIAELEAQMPKEGAWIWDSDTGTYHCSECNTTSPQEDQDGEYIDCPNYCQNCGSRMRRGEQE